MQRPASAPFALLLSACLGLIAVSILATSVPALAEDAGAVKQAQARRKKAIEEDALAMNYQAAIKDLRAAIETCDRDRCTTTFKGGLFRDLGAMQMLAGAIEDGRASFAQALSSDPSLELDPLYKNPLLEGLWADAKRKAGAPGGAAAPPPSTTGAAPAPPPPPANAPPAEEPAGPPGSQPAGEFVHMPPTEHPANTPLAVYVSCRVGADGQPGSCDDYVYLGTDKLARVALKYKGAGMTDYKPLELQKMGTGYGAVIPCADVIPGTMRYYVQGFSEANDPIAASGSRSKPFTVTVKSQTAVPVTSLPGQPPPERCGGGDAAGIECPPDFPGCHPAKKGGGQSCEMNSQCKSNSCVGGLCIEKKEEGEDCETNEECASTFCKEDKCVGSTPPETSTSAAPRVWIGVAGSLDFFMTPGTDHACDLVPSGVATVNTVGYNCVDPTTNAAYPDPQNPMSNKDILNPGQVGGGFARGNARIMATIDFEVRRHLLIGARVGYIVPTMTASFPGPAFPPIHLEARATWVFDGESGANKVAPLVFLAAGAGEFDAFVQTTVKLQSTMMQQTENAWITAGPAFVAGGPGLRFLLGPKAALTAAVKAELAFGGTAGSLFGLAPELGVMMGL